MPVSSIAGEVIFSAGWIAVGAAAAYSRYKKSLELAEKARGASPAGAIREYHNGLYFGRGLLPQDPAPGTEEASLSPDARSADAGAALPVSLAALAQALQDAERKAQPKEEKAVVR